jgi:hypothetical protein
VRIARSCLHHRVNPILFVDETAGKRMESGPPPPEMLLVDELDPNSIADWVARSRVAQMQRVELELAYARIKPRVFQLEGMSELEAVRRALMDRLTLLSPLQRLIVAEQTGQLDIVDRLREQATLEYLIHREVCVQVFDTLVPELLRDQGEAFYALVDSDEFWAEGGPR